jgi:hypothetical protein
MKKQERLLRIAGLLIIIRDELEEQDFKHRKKQIVNRFIKCANNKLNELSNGGQDVNKEFELVYTHLHKSIEQLGLNISKVINELVKLLEIDLNFVRFSGELKNACRSLTNLVTIDLNIVEQLDNKLRLEDESNANI